VTPHARTFFHSAPSLHQLHSPRNMAAARGMDVVTSREQWQTHLQRRLYSVTDILRPICLHVQYLVCNGCWHFYGVLQYCCWHYQFYE
jgi:hypothetical protein